MNLISFFSGIGGFELAGEWMGWNITASCEINPFGMQVLKYYWPNAYHHDDIKTINYEEIKQRIDRSKPSIIVGGFPCQPYSNAGRRLGKEDERHLWPYCVEAIRAIQPEWCVFENVRGLTNWNAGMVFDEVQADMEAEGYEVLPFLLPACAVNAPHRRDRIWFIAHRIAARSEGGREGQENASNSIESIANASSNGWRRGRRNEEFNIQQNNAEIRNDIQRPDEGLSSKQSIANTGNPGLQGSEQHRTLEPDSGREQPSGSIAKFHKAGDWQHFPTQSPICSRNDGLSSQLVGITVSKHRQESLKGYGNAIVPQVAYEIFQAIQAYINSGNTNQ
jgi:DNA (cytosine-5)-methyltransferase 1